MIEFHNVSYGYGGKLLLGELNLSLLPGSFHFLTGPSGAGKTTFLKLCYKEINPASGHVTILGKDARFLSRDDIALLRQKIGVIHQDSQFLDHLNVLENVALPLTVAGRPRSDDDIMELLQWVGLGEQAYALPQELSGGERQRVALARALITSPDIILADEPTGNVDWEMSTKLLHLLVELNKMGKTVVIATHDMHLIRKAKASVQTRVMRIANQRLQLAGSDL